MSLFYFIEIGSEERREEGKYRSEQIFQRGWDTSIIISGVLPDLPAQGNN